MEVTPEMYLNLDNFEMHGPSSIRPQGEPEPAPQQQPQTVDEIATALRKAELAGDHAGVQLLSVQLDDALAGVPAAAPESSSATEEESTEAKEAPSDEDFHESFFHQNLVREVGDTEEVNALYSIINDSADQETISAFFESAQGDGKYASEVVSWARNVQQANAVPDVSIEAQGFSEGQASELLAASEYGSEILALNNAVVSGQISQQEMFMQVVQNPSLMAEAVRLRNANLISF